MSKQALVLKSRYSIKSNNLTTQKANELFARRTI